MRCEDVATTMWRTAMAGLGRLVIELVLIIVGQFLSSLDIPQRHNPDSVAILFRVAVGIARMIDVARCVLGGIPIKGRALIQPKDIDIACG